MKAITDLAVSVPKHRFGMIFQSFSFRLNLGKAHLQISLGESIYVEIKFLSTGLLTNRHMDETKFLVVQILCTFITTNHI